MLTAPTSKQLWNEELELVEEKTLCEKSYTRFVRQIYKREEDSTYWATEFERSHDNEYNSMRDEPHIEVYQVEPKEVVSVVYNRMHPRITRDAIPCADSGE